MRGHIPGYGPLPPVQMMRRTLPAMMCLMPYMLGTEVCFWELLFEFAGIEAAVKCPRVEEESRGSQSLCNQDTRLDEASSLGL